MPAQSTYFHVYNKGVENRNLFNDKEDFETFLEFLKEYLSTPPDPSSIKRSFSIKGRTFHGVPHQPKNYFNRIELVAYSLMPDHFHLLVSQKSRGALPKLIRSLCTRYAIYYNKKYQRRGSLFIGPYMSINIKESQTIYLSYHLHRKHGYSSYEEYLQTSAASWLKPDIIMSFFKGKNDYRNFVENHDLDEKERRILERIILEDEPEYDKKQTRSPSRSTSPRRTRKRTPEFAGIVSFAFALLFAVGLKNVQTLQKLNLASPITQETAQIVRAEDIKDIVQKKEPEVNVQLVTVVITDGAYSVNLREKPTTKSQKIGDAYDGDTFEFLSLESDWYQIRLKNKSAAFISARYVQLKERDR